MSKEKDTDEMSMEEILASIRRYVSDETPETSHAVSEYTTGYTADVIRLTETVDQGKAPQKADFVPYATVSETGSPSSSVHVHEKSPPAFNEHSFTAYPSKPIPPTYEPTYHDGLHAKMPPQSRNYASQHSIPIKESLTPESLPQEAPSIISQDALSQTNTAFSKLNTVFQTVKQEKEQQAQRAQSVSAIESFVMEMARPMIRQWVDQNLAALVEKIVTKEINKLMEDLKKNIL